jgi:hypothetical protein
MQVFVFQAGVVQAQGAGQLAELALPTQGFVWVACTRAELEPNLPALQALWLRASGMALLDLHVSDLLNAQLPSRYDYTSRYDLLVFHALHKPQSAASAAGPAGQVLPQIATEPAGFVVCPNVLLSVHPEHCAIKQPLFCKFRF